MEEDLRVVRTRKLLCNALFELMQEEDFDKIGVNQICERAMVHRATFYNHFSTKNDLLNFALDELQEEMFNSTIERENYSSSKEMYIDLIERAFDFLEKNRSKFNSVISKNSEKILTLIADTMRRSIKYFIGKNKYKEDTIVPVDIIIDFFMGGITFVGLDFVQKHDYSKEELLKFFNVLINEKQFIKK